MNVSVMLKIAKQMTKSLVVAAIVIAISIAIMFVNETAGIILMMLYSAWMVVKSSNKEMPLNKFTAVLPAVMSLAVFFIMLALVRTQDGEIAFIGIALGVVHGWLMARGHNVYKKNGVVYAKRTFLYVFIWAVSILFTQGSTLFGMREITSFGSFLNGFSTAMMVVLSVILFKKIISIQGSKDNSITVVNTSILFIPIIITLLAFSTSANAQNTFTQGNANSLGSYSGAPPALKDWGVRYGTTEYRAILYPEFVRLLNAGKGRWIQDKTSYQNSISWRKLNSWSFSGGRLLVDWDNNVASLEPIHSTSSISFKTQYASTGEAIIRTEEYTENSYLKDKQTGNKTHILFPVVHGLGHPVSIGPGSLAGKISTDTGFYITNRITALDTIRTNFPIDKNQQYNYNAFNNFDKQFPGCLSAHVSLLPIGHKAAGLFGFTPPIAAKKGFHRILFIPVKTVGRAPASPHLLGEVNPQDSGWAKGYKLTGTHVYRGRFLRASPSSKDKKDGIDVCTNVRNALSNDAELTIDWESKRASLSSFSIQWDGSSSYISQGQKYIGENAGKVMEFFKPVMNSSANVTFNSYGFRDISGGQLTYSHNENYNTYSKKDLKRTFDPVLFRNKPVKIQWQAIPWKNGSILVRLYVRPSTLYYSTFFHDIPAYFDLIFEKTTQSSSSERGSTSQDIGGSSTEGSTGQNNGSQSNIGFPDEETAVAGAIAALLMLFTSLGMNAATIAAQGAAASAEETVIDENTEGSSLLFDPYDDEQLPEEDGMYWAGREGEDGKWMFREEAERYISELNQEKSEADLKREDELDAFEDQTERDREEGIKAREDRLHDEGNIYDEEQDAWVRDPDYVPHYVPPRTNLEEFYDQLDYIEDSIVRNLENNSERLSKDQIKSLELILERVNQKQADNPGEMSEKDPRLEDARALADMVNDMRTEHYQSDRAQAERDEAIYHAGEIVTSIVAEVGKQSAETVELIYTAGKSKGAITAAIFETAGNLDKSFWEIQKKSFYAASETYSGNYFGDLSQSRIKKALTNFTWGSAMEGKRQYVNNEQFDTTKMATSGVWNAFTDEVRAWLGDKGEAELDDIANIKRIRSYFADQKISSLSKKSSSELMTEFTNDSLKKSKDLWSQLI